MPDDDPPPDDASETKPAVSTNDVLRLADDAQLALANPVALIKVLRYLEERIPGFTQLSAREERSLIRVSSLDPQFIEAGIRAGSACSDTKGIIGLPERSSARRRTRSVTGTRWRARRARS
jgi:hypothetical protein